MSRHRFEAYLDKVFGFSQLVSALPEGRQSPQHPWQKVFDAVFLGAAMQIPSLLQIEAECQNGALAKRIGPISDDTIGYALQREAPESVFALGCEIARRLKRNGVLRSDWSRGLLVAAVDGIEICSSFTRCCDACMQREVEHKVRGERRTDIQYYHRIVAVVIVSTPSPIPLGIRFQKDGETEVACAIALLRDLVAQLGRRFLDLLVGDALYLQAPFVNQVERLGLDWAFTLKQNQPDLLHEAERLTTSPPAVVQSESDRELRWWHLPQVDWPVADRLVRGSQNRAHGSPAPSHGQPGGQPFKERQERGGAGEHQLLRHEFRTGRGLSVVHPSTQPQPMAHRCRSVSDHHHRLSSETRRRSPKYGPGHANHDSTAGLHSVLDLLPAPDL